MVRALMKSSNDLLSFCDCDRAFATHGQMDCPWCGCGWLFTCAKCRRAFTFAELRDVPESYEDIARIEAEGFFGCPPRASDAERMEAEVEWQSFWGEHAVSGARLIYLDGQVLSVDQTDFDFEGWTARHAFKDLPHKAGTKAALEAVFGQPSYWQDRALSE